MPMLTCHRQAEWKEATMQGTDGDTATHQQTNEVN